jgi:hypothetical protein
MVGGIISDPIEYIEAVYLIVKDESLNLDGIVEHMSNIELGEMIADWAVMVFISTKFGSNVRTLLMQRGMSEEEAKNGSFKIWKALVRRDQYKKFARESKRMKFDEIANMFNRAFISADPHGEAILVVKKIHKEFDMFMHDFQHNPDILYDRIMSNIALPDILFAPSEDTKRRMFLRVMRRNNYLRAKGLCMCVLELLDTLEKIKREREERGD